MQVFLKNTIRFSVLFVALLTLANCVSDEVQVTTPKKAPPPTAMESLANSLVSPLPFFNSRMIVMTFSSPGGEDNPYGAILAEKLTTELVKLGQRNVLDRSVHIQRLKENNLSLKSQDNLDYLQKVGRVLSCERVATGIVYTSGGGLFLNVKIIDLETGLIVRAEEVFIPMEK